MTFTALDANIPLTSRIDCLKSKGIVAVGRYYTKNKSNPKLLSTAEAKALTEGGIRIWAVYQDRQNRIVDFTRDKGLAAGATALAYARDVIKQPPGSAIYFSVDFDASRSQYQGGIRLFFQGIAEAFSNGSSPYKVGVYASGMVCQSLLDEGLTTYTWLTMSTGFTGTLEFTRSRRWNLLQLQEVKDYCGLMSCDPDTINPDKPDFGAFLLPAATPAVTVARRMAPLVSPNVLPAVAPVATADVAGTASDAAHIARLVAIASDPNQLGE